MNRIVDEKTPIAELVEHPVQKIRGLASKTHPRIPLPSALYGEERRNSSGIDLSDMEQLTDLAHAMNKTQGMAWIAAPTIGKSLADVQASNTHRKVTSPNNRSEEVGTVLMSTKEDLELALTRATQAAADWDRVSVDKRAAYLEKLGELFEINKAELMALLVQEGGKAIPDAQGEVREAIDYCRYYALMARETLSPKNLPGPTGETNQLFMHGRGVFLCISPWNFPLAIFSGQVLAALAAGNCVIAKPAEQTSLIAAKAVALMHEAGIPSSVVQLLPGKGSVIGAAAVADERVQGVMLTGSTETARMINQNLAQRHGPLVPLIAETGGQNAMIADSTALPEQLVMDVVMSAFNSAGQRCSAVRVLYVQDEVADRIIKMLKGAMAELKMGLPGLLATDVGPVIDENSRSSLEAHVARMDREAKLIFAVPLPKEAEYGSYFAPRAYEIPRLSLLTNEVFGPILHVIRYSQSNLAQVIADINATGFGLTFGVHSRINSTVEYITSRIHAGNAYVNRNMIGAVVGVQPFGGEGLSGTGPKAGGPHYLLRLCHERTLSINTAAAGGNASLMSMGD